MRVGSLFSGIGGLDLGLEWAGMEIVWQSEIDEYASAVLRKHWPYVPNVGDIKAVDPDSVPAVDLVCGGYPCQPFSLAGRRKGQNDDRHLWPVMRQVVAAVRPAWVLCENVAGHITMGLDDVLSDLETLGYACQPFVIPACAVDAPHRRDRVWIVANSHGGDAECGQSQRPRIRGQEAGKGADPDPCGPSADAKIVVHAKCQPANIISYTHMLGRRENSSKQTRMGRDDGNVPDTIGLRELQPQGSEQDQRGWIGDGCRWIIEPGVGRVAHGIPHGVDRLKCLGNAVVPQVAYEIGRAIMAAHYGYNINPA